MIVAYYKSCLARPNGYNSNDNSNLAHPLTGISSVCAASVTALNLSKLSSMLQLIFFLLSKAENSVHTKVCTYTY